MFNNGELNVLEGDWIAIYEDGNTIAVKIAKSQDEVITGIKYPCYSVKHRNDLAEEVLFVL
jgi:hypothetical protein